MSICNGYAFETLTVRGVPGSLTASLYRDSAQSEGATFAFISLYGGDIRYRYDGGSPTDLEGHVLKEGGTLRLHGKKQMEDFRFIQKGKNPGEISITYER